MECFGMLQSVDGLFCHPQHDDIGDIRHKEQFSEEPGKLDCKVINQ
jgi:hypothetical protein